jgi:N-sulfoglucosamine sulfohydrolase
LVVKKMNRELQISGSRLSTLNSRLFLGSRLFALWVVLIATLCQLASAAPRNVVLFVTDDHSPDTGAYGNPIVKTPNLDALAKDGTLFTHAFCTTASCSASRSVILTGLHNHANGP